ncbi:hypothetical protein [Bradyrhizobium sp.]|uniref:hypothetical protein n=1 Tax=Bradyrhizobium sp. TaxID=376 RepID=UPI00273066BF|nr:hypothetical protein [Bradyrhizobium sp.]
MDHADRCRAQAGECHRLLLLSQSGAEATILTSLTRSWKMIANQTDRYVAIRRKEAARNGQGRLEGQHGGVRPLRKPASLKDDASAETFTSTAPAKHR